jgi:hypothetical protein
MKIIEYGICVYEGSKESHNITSKEDLLKYKQVFDLTQDPPVLVYIKTDEEVYIEWSNEEINKFAQEHIFKYYPSWKQSNILRENDLEEVTKMGNFIDSVRSWSNQGSPDPWDGSLDLIIPE